MVPRPAAETIATLRRTLLEVEAQLDPVSDAVSMAELKRIVLLRVAELETEQERERLFAVHLHGSPIVVFRR